MDINNELFVFDGDLYPCCSFGFIDWSVNREMKIRMWWIDYFECDRGNAVWWTEDDEPYFSEIRWARILKDIYLDLIDYENTILPAKCNQIKVPACLHRTIRTEGWFCTLKYGVIK